MCCLDQGERPQPGNRLSFMLHELVLLGHHSQFTLYLGGREVNELMDGQGCTILALEQVPKNLIFAQNHTQKFILQDFMLDISAWKTGENYYFCIS